MVFITLFLNRKTKNVKKSILMPLIFANYGRWLNIRKVAFPRIIARTFEHEPFVSISFRTLAIEVQTRKITTLVTREPKG